MKRDGGDYCVFTGFSLDDAARTVVVEWLCSGLPSCYWVFIGGKSVPSV